METAIRSERNVSVCDKGSMKILHVITSLRIGGAEKLMVDLLPRMKAEGHEVDLCVFDGVRTPFYEEIERRGMKVIQLGLSAYSLSHIGELAQLMRRYDIVHTHNTACQYFVAIAALFAKCRIFTTEHNTSNRRRGSRLWRVLDRGMYQRYNTIICISEETRAHLVEFIDGEASDCANKIIVINNGIDVASYSMSGSNIHPKSDVKTILMVSAFRWEKDQKTVIRAVMHLGAGYRVWFVGGGDERLMKECETLAQDLGVEKNVEFMGVRNDVVDLMHQADVLVQSSHIDGFCLAAVEGMASGLPVVVSDIPGVGDIVRNAGVLFPHKDAKALADAILKVCEDEDYRQKVVEKCLDRAKMFDIEAMNRHYLELYLK